MLTTKSHNISFILNLISSLIIVYQYRNLTTFCTVADLHREIQGKNIDPPITLIMKRGKERS